MPPFIEIRGLEHAYSLEEVETPPGGRRAAPAPGREHRILAVREVTLSIDPGEFVAIIGPNGSGKSTLARHLNGLLLPTAGQVWIDGLLTSDRRHLAAIRQKVGMVFQNPDHQLVSSTVEEDVAFGPENLGVPSAEIRQRVDDALRTVALTSERSRPPHMLSGGQKQRVAIAGALASHPACLVLDEPTSMLDPPSRRQVLATIRRLNEQDGLTVVLITHSMDEAALAGRVLVIAGGQIMRDGTAAEVFEAVAADGRTPLVQTLGLDLPFAVDVARRLRRQGLLLPAGLLNAEQIVAALC